jgi:hypothetical protein
MRQVTILDFPLRIGVRARQHRESLLREFAIIAIGGGDKADVPKRLLEIAKLHDERYSGLNPEADDALDAAIERGEEFIDFVLTVPEGIKQDTVDLAPVLLEVERYCRSGDLLTLSPPEDVRAFWIWFLSEFVRQLSGEQPRAWRAFSLPVSPTDVAPEATGP